jgi:hypothetical protein
VGGYSNDMLLFDIKKSPWQIPIFSRKENLKTIFEKRFANKRRVPNKPNCFFSGNRFLKRDRFGQLFFFVVQKTISSNIITSDRKRLK